MSRRRSSTTSLLTSLLLPLAALTAPTPEAYPAPADTIILSNQTQFNDNGPAWACPPDPVAGSGGATVLDCHEALMDMSANPQMGQFHHEPPRDAFSLPKIWTKGSCNVSLDITPGAMDYSSWTDVNLRTTQLISACARGDSYLQGATGGVRKAGNSGRIRITISKSVDGGVQNYS